MKVIIDIPKEEYDIIKSYKSFMSWTEGLIKKGVAIPEGATNGDMIKAMFPDMQFNIVNELVWTNIDGQSTRFLTEWWNAPYMKEVE